MAFDIKASFEEIEETCVPSYAHSNLAAAGVAWMRPVIAAKLRHRWAPATMTAGPVLDFGAASGELHHFLEGAPAYHFVEAEEALATALEGFVPVSSPLSMYHCDVRFPVPVVACLEPDADGYDCIV